MNIILFGIKHSGKSTIGRTAAEKAGMTFCDIDNEIEIFENKSVRQIYREQGEDAFKKAETEACSRIAAKKFPNGAVISTGGGICANKEALAVLSNFGIPVFLDVSEEILFQRILKTSEQAGSLPAYIEREHPKNEQEVRDIFHRIFTERRALYLETVKNVISADNFTPAQTAQLILEKAAALS